MNDGRMVGRASMAARLAALTGIDDGWRAAFAEVPREAFLPQVVWRDENGEGVRIDRDQNPDGWWALVYNEWRSIVTQLDDGAPDGDGQFTSSSSMPFVMARMLAQLPPHARRVAEAGAGTGWNAALLAHRYGAGNVVTVEFDGALAERAQRTLNAAGYPVHVVHGDGLGQMPGGPFDALIATFSVDSIPAAWLASVPHGRIVTPFETRWNASAAVVLDVADGVASGRFLPGFAFMSARQQRHDRARPERTTGGRQRTSWLDPWQVTWREQPAAFATSLMVPGLDYWVDPPETAMTVWDGAGSWAVVDTGRDVGGAYPVRESGPRALWGEVEAAHADWARRGRPSPDRFGLTVTAAGEVLHWIDEPMNRVADGSRTPSQASREVAA